MVSACSYHSPSEWRPCFPQNNSNICARLFCISHEEELRTCIIAMLLFLSLVFPPLFLHSLPSLISNCLNLPFGIQEISRRLRISQVALVVKNPPAKVKVKSLSRVRLLATPWTAATRLLHPWDFPGKSTGVGCHCLLQRVT